jgi:hypothetical protein
VLSPPIVFLQEVDRVILCAIGRPGIAGRVIVRILLGIISGVALRSLNLLSASIWVSTWFGIEESGRTTAAA